MKRLFPAIAALTLALAANAHTAAPAKDADASFDRQVAVFVASNIKLAIANAMESLVATGVPCDTAAVKAMVIEELGRPYDATEHSLANKAIDEAMSRHAVEASEKLLADAASKANAVTLPSGIVIETITEGDGETPQDNSTVVLRYTGLLPDGAVFDSIAPTEEPMTTVVADLMPGMAEGLTHMRKGGSYRLTVPSDLAYGHEGIGGVIPPDCALQFEIHLIDIK